LLRRKPPINDINVIFSSHDACVIRESRNDNIPIGNDNIPFQLSFCFDAFALITVRAGLGEIFYLGLHLSCYFSTAGAELKEGSVPFKAIIPQVYEFSSGPVNIWLIEDKEGLTLIDTHYRGKESEILAAVEQLGKKPADIHNILLTHCHPDHVGSLAAVKQITAAQAWMHKDDAKVLCGQASNVIAKVSPGLVNAVLFNLFIKNTPGEVAQTSIEHETADGQVLPCADGIRAMHIPGHSAGHTAYFYPGSGGVIFAGDACANMFGLDYSIVYEDIQLARQSLAKLAKLEFQAICFSQGKALKGKDVAKFKQKWTL
jgi:glyoxylase-like metal-dependent hydrolase (beta-lactamase superfamily II)